jgi:hypothetical protein
MGRRRSKSKTNTSNVWSILVVKNCTFYLEVANSIPSISLILAF